MDALDAFLTTYGLAAACGIMLIKAIGIPIPIPGDVILLATAARAAEGKVSLWLAFAALLVALTLGGLLQFLLARGPARQLVLRYGGRLGLTSSRIERVGMRMRAGGPVGIGLGVLTPGVRTAVIPACGLTGIPIGMFLLGLGLGSAVDLVLHFAIGVAGAGLLALAVGPSSLALPVLLFLVLAGLAAWLLVAQRRRAPAAAAVTAWTQATCPVCLALGALSTQSADPAVRLEGAA